MPAIDPALSPEDILALGARVRLLWDAAVDERRRLIDRWARNRKFFLNDPDGTGFGVPEGLQPVHFPLTFPKLAALVDNVAGAIKGTNPMMYASGAGSSDEAEAMQKCIQFFWENSGFKRKLSRVCQTSGICGISFVRPRWEAIRKGSLQPGDVPGRYGWKALGPAYDVIEPEHVGVSTSRTSNAETAMMVGHRFYRSKAQLEVLKAEGYYRFESVDSMAPADLKEHSPRDVALALLQDVAPTKDEDRVELIEAIVVRNIHECLASQKQAVRYGITFVANSGEILRLQPYPFEDAGYFDVRLLPEEDESFWPTSSVANALQGLQIQYNAFQNLARSMVFMMAMPPIVESGAAHDTVQPYRPGEKIAATGREVTPILVRGDSGGMIMELIQQVERQADAVVGIGQNGTATQAQGDVTATETLQIANNQSTRLGGYTDEFGAGLERIAAYTCEMLADPKNLAQWWPVYGDQIYPGLQIAQVQELLLRPWRWHVSARGPGDSPQAILAKTDRLLAMAGQFNPQPEQIAQSVAQGLVTMGVVTDPAVAMEVANQAIASVPHPLDTDEILRTAVNALDLTNADKILKKEQTSEAAIPRDRMEDVPAIPNVPAGGPMQAASEPLDASGA